ncbi:MAG: cyclic nucleotide-binding domain-containing protein [Actinomycetota bacterium]
MSDGKLEALQNTTLFSGLSSKHLDLIGQVTDKVSVEAGRVLINQGQVTTHMAIIISGGASVSVDDNEVATVGPGDVVGELSMVDGERASATVTVTESSEVWLVGRAGFIPVWEKNEEMSTPMLNAVVAKLRETNHLIANCS